MLCDDVDVTMDDVDVTVDDVDVTMDDVDVTMDDVDANVDLVNVTVEAADSEYYFNLLVLEPLPSNESLDMYEDIPGIRMWHVNRFL